jgi:hypothetical protein
MYEWLLELKSLCSKLYYFFNAVYFLCDGFWSYRHFSDKTCSSVGYTTDTILILIFTYVIFFKILLNSMCQCPCCVSVVSVSLSVLHNMTYCICALRALYMLQCSRFIFSKYKICLWYVHHTLHCRFYWWNERHYRN